MLSHVTAHPVSWQTSTNIVKRKASSRAKGAYVLGLSVPLGSVNSTRLTPLSVRLNSMRSGTGGNAGLADLEKSIIAVHVDWSRCAVRLHASGAFCRWRVQQR